MPRLVALVLGIGAALPAQAQEASPGPADDVITLPVFTVDVSQDRGYRSTNAISGTSLNMAIRDLPMPLEVINQQLIEDLQATDLKEALAYSAGVFTNTFQSETGANASTSGERSPSTAASVNDPFANAISIRGYAVPNQQRFGFRVGSIARGEDFSVVLGGMTDTANTARMEVVRGPASLLYGINVLSGIVNIIPQTPLYDPATQVSLSVGSEDYWRATLDTSGPLIDQTLAYRAVASFQNEGHWTDFQETESEYYAGQLEWRISRKAKLLLEGQYGDSTRRGIGAQYFTDTLNGGSQFENPVNSIDFRNPYNEYIRFGADLPEDFVSRDPSDPNDIWLIAKGKPNVDPYGPPAARLGDGYRITGPDTYFKRRETDLLALFHLNPLEGLNLELGSYYTQVQQEEFDVRTNLFTNSTNEVIPSARADPPLIGQATNLWVRNPEVLELVGEPRFAPNLDSAVQFPPQSAATLPNLNAPSQYANVTPFGIGEVFAMPNYARRRSAPGKDWNTWNNKYARYWWERRPTESDSFQARARLAYTFETGTPFFSEKVIKHTFTGGYQFTQDTLEVVTGSTQASDVYTPGVLTKNGSTVSVGNLANDPYLLRRSVFDYTPIRYQGEPTAYPGGLRFSRPTMGDALADYAGTQQTSLPPSDFRRGANLMRSGWREVKAWYRGSYGVYQAQMFDDRLTFIGGLRRDAYQVREREQLRIIAGTPNIDPARNGTAVADYQGSGTRAVTSYLIGYGDQPYTSDRWISELPDGLNQEVQKEMDLLRQSLGEGGTQRHLFDEAPTFDTRTAGLSFRVIDPVSVYLLYSESVFPNQGQLDGLAEPIPAEQTTNQEIGLKFDLFDGKVSGTLSYYQIERENATWYWDHAPAPRRWIGGSEGPTAADVTANRIFWAFDPESYQTGQGPAYPAIAGKPPQTYSYGVHRQFFEQAFKEFFGTDFPETFNDSTFKQYGLDQIARYADTGVIGARYENLYPEKNKNHYWVFSDVNHSLVEGKFVNAEGVDVGAMMKRAFELAMDAQDFDGFPIFYSNEDKPGSVGVSNNPSQNGAVGSLVTFSEKGTGIDGQIIFSPTSSYQIVFSFSHQQREVTGSGFNLAPLIDPNTGQKIPGTRYDRWIYILGEENFSDPTDPSTYNGQGINGMDLSFVPEWNFNLWNKYSFREGRLQGLELSAGARYYGEAPTSVSIGSSTLSFNRYPTPPTQDRWLFDAGVNYTRSFWGVQWRVAVNVYNVLDERVVENVVSYPDLGGGDEIHLRRSRILLEPRSWRLSLTALF